MRLVFPNETRPKSAAKAIASLLSAPLSRVHCAVARITGYRDWHELEHSFGSPSVSDELLPSPRFIEQQVALARSLSDELGIDGGDALYAIGTSHLTGNRKPDLTEQLQIRVRLFRKMELPVANRRERGAVGKLKTPGRNGEVVILKRFGRPTYVITHKSGDASVADFEYLTPQNPAELFIPMRLYLACGMWTEPDGARVLFSRDYCPLWRIREGRKPQRIDPWTWVKFVDQEFFWGDREQSWWPWFDASRYQAEIDRLRDFGVTRLPRLVEVLPLVVLQDDVRDFKDAVLELRRRHESAEAA